MESGSPYLIVGQGIAGTTLALTFWKHNIPFVVIDQGTEKAASRVAAGLYNPFTGPEMKLTWNANQLFTELHQFYLWAEELLEAKFFFPKPIYRPFLSIWEQNEIIAKANENPTFIGEEPQNKELQQTISNNFGGLTTAQSGFVRTPIYLDTARSFLSAQGALVAEQFENKLISYTNEGIAYKGTIYRGVVFANGLAASEGPFAYVPFRPNKGEVLNITWDQNPSFIPNRKVYLVPLPDSNTYKVGATYSNTFAHSQPTPEGKTELTEHLQNLIVGKWEVMQHLAGIRPAIADRKPVIGKHPELPYTFIFGGLGAKGVSLAPYCALKLVNHLIAAEIIPPEIQVSRFAKRFKVLKGTSLSKVTTP